MAETLAIAAPESPDSADYRTPPRNFEAEQGLLGAILINNRAFERVSEFLRPDHFADPLHGRIFEACGTLIERGQIADPTTLKHFFDSDEAYQEIGGAAYLAELAASAPTVINAEHYGRLIHDLHLRRELIELGTDVVTEAYGADLEHSAVQQIEVAEQHLYDLATTGDYEGGFKPFPEAMRVAIEMAQAAFKRDGQTSGVPTGFHGLDLLLGGLHKSDLIVLAGRPAMGKTSFALNIAEHAAISGGKTVAVFSMEMSTQQLVMRHLCSLGRIGLQRLRTGNLRDEDWPRLTMAMNMLVETNLFIDETPALSPLELRARARRLKRSHDLGLIVVDYLQLMQVPGNKENRATEISEISRSLKALAKEIQVPILALSQLNRSVEQRTDKRPVMSDLRESGAIEQDADLIVFIYREEVYNQDTSRRGMADIRIAKQRNGPIGDFPLTFVGRYTKFENWVPETYADEAYP